MSSFAKNSPAAAEPGSALPVCSGERDLDRWFRREILPLEHMLKRFLCRNWRDRAEVSDLLQETYLRVCEAARRAHLIRPKAFLFMVARNLMVDRLRQKEIVSMDTISDFEWADICAKDPTPEEHVMVRQEIGLLQDALQSLPPRCRQVVLLRKVEGYPQRDVARRMGITEDTVERQLSKGILALQRSLAGSKFQLVAGYRRMLHSDGGLSRQGRPPSVIGSRAQVPVRVAEAFQKQP